MKFKELVDKYQRLQFCAAFVGKPREVGKGLEDFCKVMNEYYPHWEINHHWFLGEDVPDEIEKVFMRPYNQFKEKHPEVEGRN